MIGPVFTLRLRDNGRIGTWFPAYRLPRRNTRAIGRQALRSAFSMRIAGVAGS